MSWKRGLPGWKSAWLKKYSHTGQYFRMAITKLGSGLIRFSLENQALEKRAALPNISGIFPAFMAFQAANNVMSGEKSLGQAAGDAVGGWAGYELGARAAKGMTASWNPKKPLRERLRNRYQAIREKSRIGRSLLPELKRKSLLQRVKSMRGTPWMKNGFRSLGSAAVHLAVPMITSMAGASVGEFLGGKALPFKRGPKPPVTYYRPVPIYREPGSVQNMPGIANPASRDIYQ